MNKYYLVVAAFSLVACGGGEEETEVNVNTGEQSSVVETTNPEITPDEHFPGDGHNHDESVPGETTTMEYFETKHDFGKVFYPSENKYTFKFKNTGNAPLVIMDAKASCGCTVPNKPEKPILPGEIGELDVIFRPKEGQIGQPVSKEITVTANTIPEISILTISADVMESL